VAEGRDIVQQMNTEVKHNRSKRRRETAIWRNRRVLLRQKIQDLHGLTPEQIDLLLTQIVANAMIREPRPAPAAPDPGDDHLWQLLRTDAGPVLVTGDQRLLERPPDFASVVSPRAFLDLLGP
jgi:predicted nucleic acid-binding protein